jgi:hypothetical protein
MDWFPSLQELKVLCLASGGGLMQAGFVLTGFYEDRRPESDGNPIRQFMPSYYVVRAQKLAVALQAARQPAE